ncbi:MAG TPA: glycoside hydrolase family 44 protein [Thermoanaerobaculia bacterium]|nr:glycoside hydrolase family 44 protein [Thermoanaerobaculia bacterium]
MSARVRVAAYAAAALLSALSLLAANPAVTVNVDAAADQKPIDPRIYGSSFASAAQIDQLGLTVNRWGGNATSRHNWAISTTNRAKDWYFENIPDGVSSGDGSNGKAVDDFITLSRNAGAEPVLTIPLMGLLPKDRVQRCGYSRAKYGNQDDADWQWMPDCGNGKQGGLRMLNVNDPADTAAVFDETHQANWIQHLVDTWGPASEGGVKYYSLDNEPSLWSADHWDIHPDGSTYDEVWSKMAEYGAAIKAVDPGAKLTGVEEWGWSGYFMSGADQENGDNADRLAHDDTPYVDWLLQQAAAYEAANELRILDILAVHFYPQNGEFWPPDVVTPAMQGFRNRSTRALWDMSYVDESWIHWGPDGGIVRLIPRLHEWVANHYPGTEIGITEYNWGADNHINGATAQADILGIFGREGLNLGVRWGTPALGSVSANAFRMYRNYDGNHSTFGDVSVSAGGPNPDDVAAFAAIRTSDGALTVMLIAKTLTDVTPATVNLANFVPSGPGQRWQLTSTNTITSLAAVPVSGSSVSLTLPAQSITLLVFPPSAAPDAPVMGSATATSTSQVTVNWSAVAGATGYEIYRSANNTPFAPLITVTTTSHNDSSLSANTTYLYQVRAVAGGAVSDFSAVDAATTILFTDPALNNTLPAKAVHVTQLRTAVNAMRAAAGLTATAFTDASLPGTKIKAVHLTELRTALDAARADLGLPALTYTNPTLTAGSTPVKAAHLMELRNGVK